MNKHRNAVSVISLATTFAFMIGVGALLSRPAQAQYQRQASYQASSILGSWGGGKTENNPSQSGYISVNFNFSFSPDGTYRENVYQGGQKLLSAGGSYAMNGDQLSFQPQQYKFLTAGAELTVAVFPIPSNSPVTDTISFSALQGEAQISLKASGSNDEWGLKRAPEDNSASLLGDTPVASPTADAATPSSLDDATRLIILRQIEQEAAVDQAARNLVHPPQASTFQPPARLIVPSPTETKPLPPNPSPEAIFKYMSNPIEIEFYGESSSNQRRVILEHAALRYREYPGEKHFDYDDFPITISSEAIFKALAEPAELDMYNQENLETQHWMQMQGVIRYVEFRLGIKLSRAQEQRLVRDVERQQAAIQFSR